MSINYRLNEKHNGVEIVFSERPGADVLKVLRDGGFHWHRTGKYWYAKQSESTLAIAQKLGTLQESTEKVGEEI